MTYIESRLNFMPKSKDFLNHLLDDNSPKPNVLILTSSADKNEQSILHNTSANFYKENGCKILNAKAPLSYDCASFTIHPISLSKQTHMNLSKDLENVHNLTLVLSSHGNIFWLLGDLPGHEKKAMSHFSNAIRQLEEDFSCKVSKIILDACYSTSELKDIHEFPNHTDNSSPARILSKIIGKGVYVCGFNGKASSGTVTHYNEDGKSIKSTYSDNVVIFENGKPLKASQHTHPGQGLYHKLDMIRTNLERPYYQEVFTRYKQRNTRNGLYRTHSFSEIELKNRTMHAQNTTSHRS